MKNFRYLFFLLISCLVVMSLTAYEYTINPIWIGDYGNMSVFFISDFDVTAEPEDLEQVMQITVTSMAMEAQEVQLGFQVISEENGQLFEEAKTKVFTVEPGAVITITNPDIITEGSDYELEDDISVNDAVDDLQNAIMETGSLPDDTYYFIFNLYHAETGEMIAETAEIVLNVLNPNMLDLLSPGMPEGAISTTATPLFTWISNAFEFSIKICEKEDGQEDAYEIIENDPIYHAENITSNVLQYPADGPELEDGHTYAWRVTAHTNTSSGMLTDLTSDVFLFTVQLAGEEEQEEGQINIPPYIMALIEQYNAEIVVALAEQGYSLPSPIRIYQNGIPISEEDLQNVIMNILSGNLEIKSINLQSGQ